MAEHHHEFAWPDSFSTPHRLQSCHLPVQLEGLAARLQGIEEERARPGRSRPEEELYLAKLAADAEREALQKLRAEVRTWQATARKAHLQAADHWHVGL